MGGDLGNAVQESSIGRVRKKQIMVGGNHGLILKGPICQGGLPRHKIWNIVVMSTIATAAVIILANILIGSSMSVFRNGCNTSATYVVSVTMNPGSR